MQKTREWELRTPPCEHTLVTTLIFNGLERFPDATHSNLGTFINVKLVYGVETEHADLKMVNAHIYVYIERGQRISTLRYNGWSIKYLIHLGS